MLEVSTEKTNGAAVAARSCAKPGCEKALAPTNRSGFCTAHFHWGKKQSRSAGDDQAGAGSNGANGHAIASDAIASAPANGHGSAGRQDHVAAAIPELAGGYREDRLDRVLLSLPLGDKAKIAAAWLRGAL